MAAPLLPPPVGSPRAHGLVLATILLLAGSCKSAPQLRDVSAPPPHAAIPVTVTPRAPLSHRACARELRSWGWSIDAARGGCPRGDRAPWFHATITNASAEATYVKCQVTAWGRGSKRLFHAYLPTMVVGPPAGVFLSRHRTREMDWFFDADDFPQAVAHLHDVISYGAWCEPWTNPPI